jgi:hypothetical protein
VVWRPLLDAEPLRIAIGWRAAAASPAVLEFASVVLELSGVDVEAGVTRIGPPRASAGEPLAG